MIEHIYKVSHSNWSSEILQNNASTLKDKFNLYNFKMPSLNFNESDSDQIKLNNLKSYDKLKLSSIFEKDNRIQNLINYGTIDLNEFKRFVSSQSHFLNTESQTGRISLIRNLMCNKEMFFSVINFKRLDVVEKYYLQKYLCALNDFEFGQLSSILETNLIDFIGKFKKI